MSDGHGWVVPGEMKAKCGGPAVCPGCLADLVQSGSVDAIAEIIKTAQDWSQHHAKEAIAATRRTELATFQLKEFREKVAALAALEEYIDADGLNAARNMRDLLNGEGDDDNDPRVLARRRGLEF